jgi:hypothetical protein
VVELPAMHHARAAGAAAVVDDKIVVSGGQANHQLVPATDVFDGVRWTDGAPIPTPRDHLAGATDGKYLYAVGGRDLSADKNVGAVERYDPVTNVWVRMSSLPTPRGGSGAGNRLVTIGGEFDRRVRPVECSICDQHVDDPAGDADAAARSRRSRCGTPSTPSTARARATPTCPHQQAIDLSVRRGLSELEPDSATSEDVHTGSAPGRPFTYTRSAPRTDTDPQPARTAATRISLCPSRPRCRSRNARLAASPTTPRSTPVSDHGPLRRATPYSMRVGSPSSEPVAAKSQPGQPRFAAAITKSRAALWPGRRDRLPD